MKSQRNENSVHSKQIRTRSNMKLKNLKHRRLQTALILSIKTSRSGKTNLWWLSCGWVWGPGITWKKTGKNFLERWKSTPWLKWWLTWERTFVKMNTIVYLKFVHFTDFGYTILRPFLKNLKSNPLAGPPIVNFDQQRALRAHQTPFGAPATLGCKSDHLWSSRSPRWISQLPYALDTSRAPPPRGGGFTGASISPGTHAAFLQMSSAELMAVLFSAAPRRNSEVGNAAQRCTWPLRSALDMITFK